MGREKQKQNYEGLKRGSFHDNWKIPAGAYLKLLQCAAIELSKPNDLEGAYGIKFQPPPIVSDSEVAQKDYLVPCEIYNDNGTEELILVNEILKMNLNCGILLQYFEGSIGPRYLRIPPNEWQHLPHRFYMGYLKSGRPPKITRNLGDRMGQGEKYQSKLN